LTVTYPLEISTDWPIMATTFALRHTQSLSRTGGGKLLAVDLAYPIWVATFQTAAMPHTDCVEFEAILNSLGGASQMFRMWDTRREYPKAYPDGAFTDAATVAEVNVDGIRISLTGLDAGHVITRGDYITMLYGGNRWLIQAAETVTADGSGNSGLFQTNPPPPYGLTVGEDVRFSRADARFRVEPGSAQFTDNQDGTGVIAWTGVQA